MVVGRDASDDAFLAVVRDFESCAGPLGASTNPFGKLTDFGTYLLDAWTRRGLPVAHELVAYTIDRPCPSGAGACSECDRWARSPHHAKIWRRWTPRYGAEFDRVYGLCVATNQSVCGGNPRETRC
mmetsp:Transcript_27663/g.85510  ORF Transcript_27663/g.85510 Transcript_27663/m.85510 type:complete len:126 (-) Transcript_27663:29-406(-)